MPKRQHIGSHGNQARPDEKMSRRQDATSAMRGYLKRVAAKKRRQRDAGS